MVRMLRLPVPTRAVLSFIRPAPLSRPGRGCLRLVAGRAGNVRPVRVALNTGRRISDRLESLRHGRPSHP